MIEETFSVDNAWKKKIIYNTVNVYYYIFPSFLPFLL